jgi:hypothetical protein
MSVLRECLTRIKVDISEWITYLFRREILGYSVEGDDRTALRWHPVFILARINEPLNQAGFAVIVTLAFETEGREMRGIRRELLKTD